LTVEAKHNVESPANVETPLGAWAEADAPVQLGLKVVTGASAVAASLADVSASLDAGGHVNGDRNVVFRAESVNIADADADALNLGFAVVGSSNADATASGRTDARISGTVGDDQYLIDAVTVEALGVNEATATADAPGGSLLLGVSGASADAVVAPKLNAGVADGGFVAAFGGIGIGTESETEARAETTATTVGLVLAVGSTPAVATVTPTLAAFVRGGASVSSARGDVAVEALHNYDGAEPLPERGAFAVSAAAGGGFVSVNSSDARATSEAVVDAFAANDATVRAGMSASFRARSKDHADASATGVTGAGIGVAGSFADANAGGTVTARVEEAAVQAGGDLEVLALGLAVTDSFGGATAGALAGGGGAAAGADSTPEVQAFVKVGKDRPIYAGLDVVINAFAQGDATAVADGLGAGGFVVGNSYATARWLPEVSAYIEVPPGNDTGDPDSEETDTGIGGAAVAVNWDIEAGGSIRVQAHSNYAESGVKETGRMASATAEASSDGGASFAGAQAIAEAVSVVHAWVGAGSTLYADGSVVIRALSRDHAESEADGNADGLLAAGGTILSQTTLGTDTRAYTEDATGDDVTRIEAYDKLRIRSDSDLVGDSHAIGGKGGLIGSGNADAATVARDPLTLARVGDFLLFAPEVADVYVAEMGVTAESRARLTSESDQVIRGLIAGNHTLAKAQLLGADTQAQVGKGVDIDVDTFELSAVARDVFVEADSWATTKFDFAKSTTAEAVVDAEVNVLAEVGGTRDAPTNIHAAGTGGLTFRAAADSVSTRALASVNDRGGGDKTPIADNDRMVDLDLTISEYADLENDIPESAGGTEIYDVYFLGGDYVRQGLRNGKDDGTKRGADGPHDTTM
jgi:hypothetical protein